MTYSDELPPESSEEAQFVLALCGIITSKQRGTIVHTACLHLPKVQYKHLGLVVTRNYSIPIDIGASAFGRDYLSTNEAGHALIDVFCSILAETPISAQWLV